jgi:hypothetical protein
MKKIYRLLFKFKRRRKKYRYSIQFILCNQHFSTLINRGLKYENAGYLLKDAVKLANNYFSQYRNV